MTRRLLVVFMVFLIPSGLAVRVRSASAQGDPGSQVIALVNGLRASYGLPPLTPHPALNAAAQTQANWVIASGQWGHTGEGGSTPQDRATAAGYSGFVLENYVGGSNMSPQGAVDWWTNSPIHLRGMLATPHEHVGVGVVTGGQSNLYVLLVGRPVTARPAANPGGSGDAGSGAAAEEEPEIIAVPVVRAEPRPDGSIVHQVQQGQTVWDLAMVYGVDLGQLRALNNLGPSMVVHPGDEIMIQLGPGMAPPPTPTVPMSVFVQEGQTLWDIAAIHNINLDELMLINGIERGQVINPGDELLLRLPPGVAPPPTPTPPLTHRVREGETAWTVAALYGLTLDELLELNGLVRPAIVYPGDELLIRTPDPTATPTEIPTETPTETPVEIPAETLAAPEPAEAPAAATLAAESAGQTPQPGGPIIVPSPQTSPAEATATPAEGPVASEATEDTTTEGETTEVSETTPLPTVATQVATQESSATPTPPSEPSGTPVALLNAPPGSPTPLPPSLTPSPAPTQTATQIVARQASVSGNSSQPYLIGAILVLVGMAALGWMALMAMLRRQQM